jgi:beta-dihydromenaquinone-9 omega-hydroxylase
VTTTARMALTVGRAVGGSTAREARAAVQGFGVRVRRRVPGGAAATDFDSFDRATIENPYPAYARLLEGPRLHYSFKRRAWIIARFDDVHAAARAHDVLSSAESVTPARSKLPMLIALDRPEHARLRKIVAPHFTRDALSRHTGAIETLARAAIDDLLAAQRPDVVAQIASPLPVDVIADVLGVPREDRPRFRAWSDQVVEGFGVRSPVGASRVIAATMRLLNYLQAAFEERRRNPGEDVLSDLVQAPITDSELSWFAVLLLLAGNETTTNLLGTMTLAFARDPDQYARVREDPSLIAPAVEEALRHGSPIQGLYRSALRDYPVGDAVIPAGGRVLLLFGAANRDPRRFADPDRFDVTREPADHVGFGTGIHFCLGAHLARTEGAAVLRELTGRVERMDLAGDPVWRANPALRGLSSLPLRPVPRAAPTAA